jgi:O-antigen/teichoic acid export membrane protein
MTKEKVRLRYSGFILFTSRLVSVATGLIFTIMVTRSTSPGGFGIWSNLFDVLSYFNLMASVIPFWMTRFVAREYEGSAKTGFVANILMSTIFGFFFIALIPTILSALNIPSNYAILYAITSILLLQTYILSALEAILYAKQPQMIGYGLLISEISKVALGFALITQVKLGLLGAMSSIIISFILQLAFYFKILANELKGVIQWTYLKEWFKASPINLYTLVGTRIETFALIFLFVYGGELSRAYYEAAITIATISAYSSYIAYALYPRLLSGGSIEDVSVSLKMVMMFAIPMTVGPIVLADSFLTMLKSVYAEASSVLILLAITSLCSSISGVFSNIVLGTEKIDDKAKMAFRELVKSRLFLVFTLPYIRSAVILPTTFFILTSVAKTPLEAANYFALITLLANSATLIATYILARKCLVFNFPWKSVSKYTLASAVMATVLLMIPHPTKVSVTAAFTLLGATVYLAVLMSIDKETRSLTKSILQEAMRIIKISKPQTNV